MFGSFLKLKLREKVSMLKISYFKIKLKHFQILVVYLYTIIKIHSSIKINQS